MTMRKSPFWTDFHLSDTYLEIFFLFENMQGMVGGGGFYLFCTLVKVWWRILLMACQIHRLNLERLNLERPNQERLNLEWTEPRMDPTPNGPNPEWTEPRMDWTLNGLNSEWDWTRMGLNSECTEPRMDSTPTGNQPRMDSTPTGTQPWLGLNPEWDPPPAETELWMGLNLDFPLNLSNGVQYVKEVYNKKMHLKRELLGVESQSGLSPGLGLNPDWELNSEWDSTSTFLSTPRIWCKQCVREVYIVYQKNGFKNHKNVQLKLFLLRLIGIHRLSPVLRR